MTNEEATRVMIAYGERNIIASTAVGIAFSMAVKALEKQMPQKPTIENGFVKCPACELYIRFPIMDRYNNCPECGQALKWEDEEE